MTTTASLSARPRSSPVRRLRTAPFRSAVAAPFNPWTFLAQVGDSRTMLQCQKHQRLFAQGEMATAVFYVQTGQVKLSVVSREGKEAVVAILQPGNFFGEGCLAGQLLYMATATAMGQSRIVRIDKQAMVDVLHNEPAFSELFMAHLLTRSLRIQEDLLDQLFNSAEKRLARTLLLLVAFENANQLVSVLPKISQETLAEMVGTTRSRVSFFMNRFKKLGFIEYNDGLRVHKARLNAVLLN